MTTALQTDDAKARRNLIVLIAAQAILGAQVTTVFVVGGLAGQMLAPVKCLATLPISMIVLGAALSAPRLAAFMGKHGRVPGFYVGVTGGLVGSGLAALAISWNSFPLFLLGSFLTGTYMAAQGFYRFAATDGASEAFRPRAISWVMAGGLIPALTGPFLVKATDDWFAIPFLGTYLAAAAINLAGSGLFLLLDLPKPPAPAAGAPRGPSWGELLARPVVRVAVICGLVSYALMNLVMTSTPLAMVGCGFATANAADAMTLHVVGMYAPSFVTGHLIARFGVRPVITVGLALLATAGVVALAGIDLWHFFGTMVLLGIGWNFGYIGATTLLTQGYAPEGRIRAQGMNDSIVMGGVTLASVTSGGLMNCVGGTAVEGWHAVNLAMTPFILLALGALAWLGTRGRTLTTTR